MSVYLDHAASSPLRPEALAAFTRQLEVCGNPSSVHQFGQSTRMALEEAREKLAAVVDCDRSEIIFTSGGTESTNLAVKGIYWQRQAESPDRKVIISAYTEHHAVIDAVEWLEKAQGAEVVWLGVSERGEVNLNELAQILEQRSGEIALIALMWANNETGVITDMKAVTDLAKPHGVPVISDGVAAFGHIPISFRDSGLQALAITAHKVGGPIGVGALVISRASKLVSLTHGGGQERSMRSGTMNPAGAVAFAVAAELTVRESEELAKTHGEWVAEIIEAVTSIASDARFSRGDAPGLPNNLHFTFPGCSGDSLLFLLDSAGVAVSTGSACTAGVASASHVLLAMGRSAAEASGTLRITFGYSTTRQDIDAFLAAFPAAYEGAKKAGLNGAE